MRGSVAQRGLHGKAVDRSTEHRLPEVTPETAFEQIGSAVGPRGDGGLAEHDGDEAPAVPGGARHYVKA